MVFQQLESPRVGMKMIRMSSREFIICGFCRKCSYTYCLLKTLQSFELQEEGNAAAVVESVRAGLVVQLKETVTAPSILQRLEKITK